MIRDRLASIGEQAPNEIPEVIRLITAGLAGVAANQSINMNLLTTFIFWIGMIALFSFLLRSSRIIFGDKQEQTKSVIYKRICIENDSDEWTEEIERQQAS